MNPSIRPRRSGLSRFGELLAAGLPPIVARLRERELQMLADRLGGDLHAPTDMRRIGALLVDELRRLRRLHAELGARREAFQRAADAASSAAEYRAVLAEELRRTRSGWALRQDLRALERWLDADAILERHDRRQDDIVVRMRLVVRLLARHIDDGDIHDDVVALLDFPDRPLRRLVARTLAEGIVRRRRADPTAAPGAAELRLVAVLSDRAADPLVARQAARAVAVLPDGVSRLAARLDAAPDAPDDFLVRAEIVRLLVAAGPQGATKAAAWASTDASETVRAAAVRALVEDGGEVCRRLAEDLARDDPAPCVMAALRREAVVASDPTEAELRTLRRGESVVVTGVEPLALAERLLPFVRTDWGYSLEALGPRRVRVTRGVREVLRPWRLLHELRHPDPGKRQGGNHLVGRTWRGPLRVPSRRLAEISPTGVPGQPVRHDAWDGWCPWLPLLDDLFDALGAGTIQILTDEGLTSVTAPTGREAARVWWTLTRRAAHFDHLRNASLTASDGPGRVQYVKTLERLGFRVAFEPRGHTPLALYDVIPEAVPPVPAEVGIAVLPTLAAWWSRAYGSSDPRELLLVTAAIGTAFAGRLVTHHRTVRRARARVPLVLGGWGTRGKSGVERLKAALFEGLGVEVVCKTTGCEAMLLHNPPGRRAVELFLYRPYDRATIWEHAGTLEVAAQLGAPVFLWECMALKPHYVEILQRHWTRDDASTITNTYPDHEDVHGPAGHDVAEVISRFLPDGALAVTAEAEMTAILRDRAEERKTALVAVSPEEVAQVPADLLARFPHQEHPANVALVAALARELGIDPEEAIVLMADHVLPDLGSLATFPAVRHRGRVLEFTNGSSANERTGFLNNWRRTGFASHDNADVGTWLVTVVNNRYDRVARSHVFAEILVRDACAHRHVLIGTNLEGLRGYIREAADRWLSDLDLTGVGAGGLRERLRGVRRHLKVVDTERLVQLIGARLGAPEAALAAADAVARVLSAPPARPLRLDDAREAVAGLAPAFEAFAAAIATLGEAPPPVRGVRPGSDTLFHDTVDRDAGVSDLAAHLLTVTACELAFLSAGQALVAGGRAFEPLAHDVFRDLLMAKLVVVEDAKATGDQIIDQMARSAPAGVVVRAMSIQNIKGTGLDFVYRWVYGRPALDWAADLGSEDPTVRDTARAYLDVHREWCTPVLREVATTMSALGIEATDPLLVKVRSLIGSHETALTRSVERRASVLGRVRKVLLRLWDPFDALFRRWTADRVFADLGAQRISHARAAVILRELTERGKGA